MNKGRIEVDKFSVPKTNWEINRISSEIMEFCSEIISQSIILPAKIQEKMLMKPVFSYILPEEHYQC